MISLSNARTYPWTMMIMNSNAAITNRTMKYSWSFYYVASLTFIAYYFILICFFSMQIYFWIFFGIIYLAFSFVNAWLVFLAILLSFRIISYSDVLRLFWIVIFIIYLNWDTSTFTMNNFLLILSSFQILTLLCGFKIYLLLIFWAIFNIFFPIILSQIKKR